MSANVWSKATVLHSTTAYNQALAEFRMTLHTMPVLHGTQLPVFSIHLMLQLESTYRHLFNGVRLHLTSC